MSLKKLRLMNVRKMILFLFLLIFFQKLSFAIISLAINTQYNVQGIYFLQGALYSLEQDYKNATGLIFVNRESVRELVLQDHEIGHQGFGLSRPNETSITYIWTGKKKSGRDILVFRLDGNNAIRKETVTLFPADFMEKNETMPAISSDSRFLLARGRNSAHEMVIRVFDLNQIYVQLEKSDVVDFSKNYLYQWTVSSKQASELIGYLQPLQAIASDGKEVSLLFGNARLTPKTLYFFTPEGNLLLKDSYVTTGIEDALAFPEQDFYEPEGLSYDNNQLKILFTYAKGINRRDVIYDYEKPDLNMNSP